MQPVETYEGEDLALPTEDEMDTDEPAAKRRKKMEAILSDLYEDRCSRDRRQNDIEELVCKNGVIVHNLPRMSSDITIAAVEANLKK